jgi:hypothetical protein
LKSEQLRHALDSQKQDGSRRIGEYLCRLGFVTEPQITAALGRQWSCPVLRALPDAAGDSAIPLRLLGDFRMVPVHFNSYTRPCMLRSPATLDTGRCWRASRCWIAKPNPAWLTPARCKGWLKSRELQGRGADQGFENICQPDEITRITSSYATKCCADDARLTRCGEYIWVRVEDGFDTANLLFRRAQHCE